VREGMADIDRDALPTVSEARETQREHMRAGESLTQDASRQETTEALQQPDGAERADHVELRAVEKELFSDGPGAPAVYQQWQVRGEAAPARLDPVELSDVVTKPGLAVVDVATGVAEKLTDFVTGLLGGIKPQPQEFSSAGSAQQLAAQRKALEAMENIRKSLERGDRLMASDVQNLTPAHLENIKQHGDDYLRLFIDDLQRDRAHEYLYGRARER
jgi:hypothetical protein